MKEVKELVEWAEEIIKSWIIKNYPIGTETFDDLAKHILSHPNLALIVDRELPKNPIKITSCLGLTEGEATVYQLAGDCFVEVVQDQMLNAGYKPVIPLAEALKSEVKE